jgi:hypothetical protein
MSPNGDWIAVSGEARGRWDVYGNFAVNLETGETSRFGIGPRYFGTQMAFSGDGKHAVWAVTDREGWLLRSGPIDSIDSGGVGVEIPVERIPTMALSHRGDRLAVIDAGNLVVSELPSGDLLGSAKLPTGQRVFGPYFASDDHVRFLANAPKRDTSPPAVTAVEFQLSNRRVVELGTILEAGEVFSVSVDAGRDRLLIGARTDRGRRWMYVEGKTMDEIPLAGGSGLVRAAAMLADGSIVRSVRTEGVATLDVLTPDRLVAKTIQLRTSTPFLVLGFQPSHTTLVIGTLTDEGQVTNTFRDWTSHLVDLETGEMRQIAAEHMPTRWWYSPGEITTPVPVGSPATRMLIGEGRVIRMWDPETDEIAPLLPRA